MTRDDGSKQWAFQGMPLYRIRGDSKPGDATGDNQGGVWHVSAARREAAASARRRRLSILDLLERKPPGAAEARGAFH